MSTTERQRIPGLLEEQPLLLYPTLAAALGSINQAAILQQLHFLVSIKAKIKDGNSYFEGTYWIYNTYEAWRVDWFPWLSIPTIKRLFRALEGAGLVRSRPYPGDERTKYYTINRPAIDAKVATYADQNDPQSGSESGSKGSENGDQNDPELGIDLIRESGSKGSTPPIYKDPDRSPDRSPDESPDINPSPGSDSEDPAGSAAVSDDGIDQDTPPAVTDFQLLLPSLRAIGIDELIGRGLLNSHGLDRTLAVLLHAQSANAKNPAGLAIHLLEKGAPVSPENLERARVIQAIRSTDPELIGAELRQRKFGQYATPPESAGDPSPPSGVSVEPDGLDTPLGRLSVRDLWRYAVDQARTFNPGIFRDYLSAASPLRFADGLLTVQVPTPYHEKAIQGYLDILIRDINELAAGEIALQFIPVDTGAGVTDG